MVLEHLDALCLQGIPRHEGTVRRRAILVEDEPDHGPSRGGNWRLLAGGWSLMILVYRLMFRLSVIAWTVIFLLAITISSALATLVAGR